MNKSSVPLYIVAVVLDTILKKNRSVPEDAPTFIIPAKTGAFGVDASLNWAIIGCDPRYVSVDSIVVVDVNIQESPVPVTAPPVPAAVTVRSVVKGPIIPAGPEGPIAPDGPDGPDTPDGPDGPIPPIG